MGKAKKLSAAAPKSASLMPDAVLVKIALRFVLIYLVLQAALWLVTARGYFEPVLTTTAAITGACSNVLGTAATVDGNRVNLASRILRIDRDCTAVLLMLLYSALVLAYPLDVRRRLVALAVGIPIIAVANMARLTAVALVSAPLGDAAFSFVHDYLFKIAMMGVVIVLWAAYLQSARRDAR